MTGLYTLDQSWAIMLSLAVASMMIPIMVVLIRYANARRHDR